MKFWLGTHMTEWLGRSNIPLFVSAIQMRRRPFRRKAVGEWALDSGGFTELSTHGRWTVEPRQYVDEVRRWRDAIGGLQWAAIQDWMCEPFITAKTGYTVLEHQNFTVKSWLDLNDLAPEIPWVPVLQGWHHDEYLQHVYLYERYAGLDLARLPLVGIGSVCRRQHTGMAEDLIRDLHDTGIKVHGFGFKLDGLRRCARWLESADSLAWSFTARKADGPMLPDCTHAKCANCRPWAETWRRKVLQAINSGERRPRQLTLC